MLTQPLPKQLRVIRVSGTPGGERLLTMQLTLPEGVVSLWAEALEIAARMATSDHLGAAITAMSQEEAERRALAAIPGAVNGAAGRTSPRP